MSNSRQQVRPAGRAHSIAGANVGVGIEAVVAEGDLLLEEFGEVMWKGEREGFFREGGVDILFKDLARFRAWLAEHGHALAE